MSVKGAWRAKYPGTCPVCNVHFEEGTMVHYQRDKAGLSHVCHEGCIIALEDLKQVPKPLLEKQEVLHSHKPKEQDQLAEYERALEKYFKEWFDFASFMMDQVDETKQRLRKLMAITPKRV